MKSMISICVVGTFFCTNCKDPDRHSDKSKLPQVDKSLIKVTRKEPSNESNRISGRAYFESKENRKPENLKKFVETRASESGVTESEAMSSLFDEIVAGKDQGEKIGIFSYFYQVISSHEQGLAGLASSMPAGDLRKQFVNALSGVGIHELLDIYHAMPESTDRKRVAERAVTKAYYTNGFDFALQTITSIPMKSDSDSAIEKLVNQMGAVYRGIVPSPPAESDPSRIAKQFEIIQKLAKERGPELATKVNLSISLAKRDQENSGVIK